MPRRGSKPQNRRTQAQRADRYALYLNSVQEPATEVAFFQRVYRKEFGEAARVLREDFCGAAAVCYEWVRRRPDRRAIGVDLDPEPLDWGLRHLAPRAGLAALKRVALRRADVREVGGPKADLAAAQNFSFWCFKTRAELGDYFRAAYRNLKRRGLFVLDMMGGSECFDEDTEEETEKEGFTYVWEQSRFDPITHACAFHIHFRFPDGSEQRRAFSYDWRLWTLPEVRELLAEAGFRRSDVYWEGTTADGEGDGVYRKRTRVEPDPAWIAYLVAVK